MVNRIDSICSLLFLFITVSAQLINPTHKNVPSDSVKQCDCMKYWDCIHTGGTPHSYCGLSDVCCFNDALFEISRTSFSSCGKKGADSGKDGISEPAEWPWHAAILEKTQDLYVCGGSLIDETWVLTAAHCVDDYRSGRNLKVRLGEHDVATLKEPHFHREYDVSKIFVHPQFNNNTLLNDLALIKLVGSAKKQPNINIICLPEEKVFSDFELQNSDCVVTGWGREREGSDHSLVLKEVRVPLWQHKYCEIALQKHFGPSFKLANSVICAGNENGDACDGDGGGPLACSKNKTWFLMGIVSFGIGCRRPNTPGVYTKIESYIDWILQVAAKVN